MVDLLDRFQSEDLPRSMAAGGRASSQGRGGGQTDRTAANPFDEIEIGNLQPVSAYTILSVSRLANISSHLLATSPPTGSQGGAAVSSVQATRGAVLIPLWRHHSHGV